MTIAKAAWELNSAWRRRHPDARNLPALLLMTDPERLPDPGPYLRRLPRGSGVIYRCYGEGPGRAQRLEQARRLRSACRRRGILFIVAGDDGLAQAVRADGIHLAEWRLRRGAWMRGPARARHGLVTASCHGRAAIAKAARAGADAVLLAPVFATASHPGARAMGHLHFCRLARRSRLPVYALGGIDPDNVGKLRRSGAVGIAGIGGLIAS
ncbi:MAG TPA: thiamine phosphate synthase [Alphaproteobacteria bacterium]|nr:thiamine phosphate synthase [Alphaproteobacteria bacterium]